MPQKTLTIFIVLTSLILLIFIAGIVVFIIQYRRGKVSSEKEKNVLKDQHEVALLNTKLESQQQTMQHIGREIHDNVGQKLTLASLYSKQLNQHFNEKLVNDIGVIIDESLAELRQLSKSLTNTELSTVSLEFLLKEEAKRVHATGICQITIESPAIEIKIPPAEKNILFRLLQEFIQNSLKHSGCRNISISMLQENGKLSISATDDGRGFDTRIASAGIGLQNMKRRASQLNAGYILESVPGKGTMLSLELTLVK